MISKIIAAIGVIKEVIALIRMLMGWVKDQQNIQADKKLEELERAIEDSKNARTAEEAYEAQERIIGNKS